MDNQKGIVEVVTERIWKFFSSVKLAVVLLIILAIVSVVGTVIQQNEPTETYLQEYSPATVRLFEALGLFDMYHTWWFVLILFLFTANLTVCTLERFPMSWKAMRAPLKPLEDEGLKALPFKKELNAKGGFDTAEEQVRKALSGRRYRYQEIKGPGTTHLVTQKGAFSRMGVYITHVSIMLIFIGALIGAFFGFKAFLNLPEGEASQVVYLRNEPMWDRIMALVGIGESSIIPNPQGGVPAMPLGFYVRCDDFDVDYYQNQDGNPTGMPSEYHSTLSVFSLGRQKIFDKRIRVNDPLTYHGITFYQSSYGTVPNVFGKVVLEVRKKNSAEKGQMIVLDPGQMVPVPFIDRTFKVLGVEPFGMRDHASGKVMFYQARNNELINPAVGLEVYRGAKPVYRTEILRVDPGQPYLPEDYEIRYVDYWGARYTGLQVTKDPGVWVVYSGFILLCIGPLIAFFGSHRKLWVRIQDRKGQAVITVAGTANRNRIGFEREFNRITEEISK
ncbi:MAG TPA: cytochrome c biogenesis protein ResB [Nitrospirota bacterium]|nr:cytochrome c biogenesis protein ResB [Nitrospirota bacterium]